MGYYNGFDTEKKVVVSNGGLGLGTIGFITWLVFLIIKLTVNPVWLTWFWVWFPFWIPWAIAGAIIAICLLIALIVLIVAAVSGNL